MTTVVSYNFAIDRWHFSKNHKGCTRAFDMRQYRKFDGINSSLQEQENRFLSRILTNYLHEIVKCHVAGQIISCFEKHR